MATPNPTLTDPLDDNLNLLDFDINDWIPVQNSRKRQRPNSVEANPSPNSKTAPKKSAQSIIVSGILPEISNNPITLAKLINEEKPNAMILNINRLRSNDILITPHDPKSANILLQPWTQNTKLGNPKPRIPQKTRSRNFSVVACGINPEIQIKDIEEELKEQEYSPTQTKRLISRATNNPTWKVKITFEDKEQQQTLIKQGLYLGYSKHKTEEYNEPPQVTQCFKCQLFGHTHHTCKNQTRCLRCGENHRVKECPEQKENTKCANCSGSHAALYKGCPKFKEAKTEAINKQQVQRTYANVTKAAPKIEITNKIATEEKLNITTFVIELVQYTFQKANISIKPEDLASYSTVLALKHLNLNIPKTLIMERLHQPSIFSPPQSPK